ncbi:hypothetical protein EIN_259500 [Entamoeba invadens IP1]|uniref:Leucine rich repeat containing protein BspA family protein n=1 Tax=Entamoeba invadens IP1 TaxID=370355 RepID=A0A0A1TV80_ENTIV|nr:hypothetical protein EIN_259500 [Entamoeba invadens IP1]ELP84206.1 hypothetical protein EIN_259500 [Entamoeba invadens IP1]|eukprot:XP_004183552.1 hypothetical protein EIN_259500 [Entamoeba invadens IP1]
MMKTMTDISIVYMNIYYHNSKYLELKTDRSKFKKVRYTNADYLKYKTFEGATILSNGCFSFEFLSSTQQIFDMHNILSFGTQCFYKNTSLQEIYLDKRLTILPFKCFSECKNLKEIDLFYVTNIGDKCFEECSKLSSITLAKSLDYIGSNAFFHCHNIKNVTTNGLKKLNTLINFSSYEAFKSLNPSISLSFDDIHRWNNSRNALFEYPISQIESQAFF